MTATVREAANANCGIRITNKWKISTPTVGRVLVVLAELTTVIVLCFYGLNTRDRWQWEDIGYRTGFIAATQLPLVVLLAGKNNIIGYLIGSSYERLNWLHRWAARSLFLTVTIHMGFWFTDWKQYDYIKVKLKTDAITKRGFAAWCILLWIVLSSFAPTRRLSYEFFVIQHIITFVGFFAAVYMHLPSEVKVWVWLPIGFYIFDRATRTAWLLWANLSFFHPKTRAGQSWALEASLESLSGGMTKVVIKNPPISWRPGQHLFLACHGISPFQSHPFTIASLPQDGQMEFVIKSKSGYTKRLLGRAERQLALPTATGNAHERRVCSVVIDGPYGYMRPLRQFDSVLLVAGSNGIAFTLPLMRDIVAGWTASASATAPRWFLMSSQNSATRFIKFVWIIKSQAQVSWFSSQLAQVMEDVENLRRIGEDVEISISIYVTCDPGLAGELNEGTSARLKQKDPFEHGRTEPIPNSKDSVDAKTERPTKTSTQIAMQELRPSQPHKVFPTLSCHPIDNTKPCCCQTTITDETSIPSATTHKCTCNDPRLTSSSDSATSSLSLTNEKPLSTPLIPQTPSSKINPSSSLQTLTGRPHIPSLVRKLLEQALGESAVVACGPKGLEDDTRAAVVRISDERAVCKGTGALGVWFWGEGFDS